MKILVFYITQIVILGGAGFAAFLGMTWWQLGLIPGDAFQVLLLSLASVAFFVVLSIPLQLVFRYYRSPRLALVAGFLFGPIAVASSVANTYHHEFTIHNYVTGLFFYHCVFAVIGLCFAFNFQRSLGPNNSIKPTWLRHAAYFWR